MEGPEQQTGDHHHQRLQPRHHPVNLPLDLLKAGIDCGKPKVEPLLGGRGYSVRYVSDQGYYVAT
jgi:hypothetical protein